MILTVEWIDRFPARSVFSQVASLRSDADGLHVESFNPTMPGVRLTSLLPWTTVKSWELTT